MVAFKSYCLACLAVPGWLAAPIALAAELHLAVASNFKGAMEEIAAVLEEESGHELVLSFGSTGKHYAQIANGAPFDAFLAADSERPRRLEENGSAVDGSRFTYAIGRLVLWSPATGLFRDDHRILVEGEFRFLAIANPELAPYGRAAEETLGCLGVWHELQGKIVRGENIAQAYQYVKSGNAELGFVALSQVVVIGEDAAGSTWLVPQEMYSPIEQQAVLLADSAAGRGLMAFLRGPRARRIIHAHGYATP